MFVHSACLDTMLNAARQCNIPEDHIILIDEPERKNQPSHKSVPELVKEGVAQPITFIERKLSPGEAKSKVAFLCLSSGTTGKPKVCIQISHHL